MNTVQMKISIACILLGSCLVSLLVQADRTGSELYFQKFFAGSLESGPERLTTEVPCCFPKQLEGIMTTEFKAGSIRQRVFYYDETNDRVRIDILIDGGNISYIILLNATRKSADIYSVRNGKCHHFVIDEIIYDDIVLPCFFKNAAYIGEGSIGAGSGDSVMVKSWMATLGTNSVWYFKRTVSAKNCAPVSEYVSATRYLASVYYSNLKLSISDPSVFSPPSNCTTSASDRDDKTSFLQSFGRF